MIDPSLFTLPYDDHLCGSLFERGNSVTLFTRPLREEEPKLEFEYWKSECFYLVAEDTRLRRLPSSARLVLKGVEHSVEMASLLRDLRRHDPSIIHFQWLPAPLLDRFYMPMFRRVAPTVLTVHDTGGFLNPSSRIQLAGWTELLRSFDQLVVHLESSKRELVSKGLPPERISVIPHGVLSYGRPPRKAPTTESGAEREILLFGAIKPYKGPDLMIRAFAALPEDLRKSTRLAIVGELFVSIEELERLARELGVADRIRWDIRYVPNEELPQIMRRADVFAFPYRRIDASGVLMMALPYGTPIVATRVGCFEELLEDGVTAALAPPEDPEAFARVLEGVLRDQELANRIGGCAKKLGEDQLSWGKIAAKTEAVYNAIVNRRRPSLPEEPSGLGRPQSEIGQQLERHSGFDQQPVHWRGLLAMEGVAQDIGELSLYVAFADGRLESSERELIIDALSEMDDSATERRSRARKQMISLLENLDLTTEHFHQVTARLAQELDRPQKAFLIEVLFMVAVADAHLHPREKDILLEIATALEISSEKVQLMIDGFNCCIES